ncbi:MAG: hypothetical protein HY901_22540, partial [Deltaproteobacteria bacterium]|nr:hypothetical protein [Deltaproteobacteria bacterium]
MRALDLVRSLTLIVLVSSCSDSGVSVVVDSGVPAVVVDASLPTVPDAGLPTIPDAGGLADAAVCQNGIVEAPETCDGNCATLCYDGKACTKDSLWGSPATCDVECR